MALGGVGSTPQDQAAKAIQEKKGWDAVEKTDEDRKIAKQNATMANCKAIRY
ncbi:hypothetical protein [Pseudomonas sp. S09G 359]|jgi:hypothetical protein|uniref:hypothetical protein n=1 Tax=Pseudomonas sp. S09G 359 TaxID=2054919 RepID=UPI0012FEDD06|nr:hypothetical protein [Pseudomonas sp. S09G 359]